MNIHEVELMTLDCCRTILYAQNAQQFVSQPASTAADYSNDGHIILASYLK